MEQEAIDELSLLKEKQRLRFRLLKTLYFMVDGRKSRFIDYHKIRVELKYSDDEMSAILEYLIDEGLVLAEHISLRITHTGILEVEHAIENPGARTKHFMASVINHFHGDVGINQTGDHNISQT